MSPPSRSALSRLSAVVVAPRPIIRRLLRPSSSYRGGNYSSGNTRPHSSSSSSSSSCGGLLASMACSAVLPATAIALCDDDDGSDDDDDDRDFISKIRSKIENQNLPNLSDLTDLTDLLAENKALDSIMRAVGSQISSAIASGIPSDVSYGFLAGYFSGLALKKIGKVASITLGASFLALQTLAYHGYIDIHHEKLQKEVGAILDRNGDGVVDSMDLKMALDEVRRVAGFGLEDKNLAASGGGFGMGFWGGLRSG